MRGKNIIVVVNRKALLSISLIIYGLFIKTLSCILFHSISFRLNDHQMLIQVEHDPWIPYKNSHLILHLIFAYKSYKTNLYILIPTYRYVMMMTIRNKFPLQEQTEQKILLKSHSSAFKGPIMMFTCQETFKTCLANPCLYRWYKLESCVPKDKLDVADKKIQHCK